MSNSIIAPSPVQQFREVYPTKQAAQQRIQERYEAGFRAIASPISGSTEWELHWENTNPATTDDSPRWSLADESAYPPADNYREDYLLLESNHGTDKAEVIGSFFSSDDAVRTYSAAAWEAEALGGLRLQLLHRHRPVASGVYVTVTGEAFPALVWLFASGEVRRFVRRVNDCGEVFAQLVW